MMIYLTGVVVMAFAILYFNWNTLKVLSRERSFWFAMLLICLTSWVGVAAAVVIYLISKYNEHHPS